ncbi:MAG: TorF family putative porin [Gammaproteobacteria bacterium]|nr:MAG: TorF family putative porin [Gammaproteobacteria bacterium]
MKKTIVLATAVASVLTSGIAAADLTANAGAFSNYIFRGTTYSGDSAVVQGGIDWSDDSGVYAGTWVSTLGTAGLGGGEIDLYVGYSGDAGGFGYDLGVLTYQYTSSPEFNYTEAYVSGTFNIITVGLNYTVDAASGNKDAAFDTGDIYFYGSADFAAGPFDTSLYAGTYQYTNDGKFGNGDISYSHFGASVSKDSFTFAVDKSDVESSNSAVGGLANNMDAVRFTVSFTKDFQL